MVASAESVVSCIVLPAFGAGRDGARACAGAGDADASGDWAGGRAAGAGAGVTGGGGVTTDGGVTGAGPGPLGVAGSACRRCAPDQKSATAPSDPSKIRFVFMPIPSGRFRANDFPGAAAPERNER